LKFKKIALSICFALLVSTFLPAKPVQASTSVSDFVRTIYLNVQNREPDTVGLNYWTNRLKLKKTSGADIVKEFILSAEFTKKGLSNEQYINTIYKTVLNRSPDLNGNLHWTGLLNSYYTRLNILSQIISSTEFATTCKSYGILQGQIILTDPMDIHPKIAEFVDKSYSAILNRKSDYTGLKYHVTLLAAKKITASQLIEMLTNSDEYIKSQISSNEYITRLYKGTLLREPDKQGFNVWLNFLMNGYSRRFLLNNFVNSPEFKNLCAKSNLAQGTIALSSLDYPYNGVIVGYTNTILSLRSAPSTSSKVIASIPNGSKVIISNRFFDTTSHSEFYQIKWIKNPNNTPVLMDGYSSAPYIHVITDTVNNSMLGVLSGQYESNGNPGSVSSGVGDSGGVSYGVWQLSSKVGSLSSFMLWLSSEDPSYFSSLDNARKLDGGTYGTNFNTIWKTFGLNDYREFYELQHKYIKSKYYDVLVNNLMSTGNYEPRLRSFAVRNVLWSTAVHHGASGAYNIISKFKSVTDINQFISSIYAERSKVDIYFSSSPTLHASLINRFIREKADALKVYNYEVK